MSDSVLVPPSASATSSERGQFWRQTIASFTTSGLSVREFCRARGLHEKRFYTWRRNLGLSPVTRNQPDTTDTPATAFGPIRVMAEPTAEIVLPGGLTLRLPLSADPTHVGRLLAVLRGMPC